MKIILTLNYINLITIQPKVYFNLTLSTKSERNQSLSRLANESKNKFGKYVQNTLHLRNRNQSFEK